jgi:hypothetical protein
MAAVENQQTLDAFDAWGQWQAVDHDAVADAIVTAGYEAWETCSRVSGDYNKYRTTAELWRADWTDNLRRAARLPEPHTFITEHLSRFIKEWSDFVAMNGPGNDRSDAYNDFATRLAGRPLTAWVRLHLTEVIFDSDSEDSDAEDEELLEYTRLACGLCDRGACTNEQHRANVAGPFIDFA